MTTFNLPAALCSDGGAGDEGRRSRIAVFRALHLGDMLCAVPALRALRCAAPGAHITLIGMPWAAAFAARFARYIDAHAAFPGFPMLSDTPVDLAAIPRFIADMQSRRFDAVIQMHGSGALSNALAMSFGARRHAGFYRAGEYCPDPARFLRWECGQHEVVRNLQLMALLGAPAQGEDLEFPLSAADYRALFASHDALPAPGSYVCLHPGARVPSRRWPARRFAELAERLYAAGWQVVLTGAAQEKPLAAQVAASARVPLVNLAGKLELGAFAALVAQARALVCHDTGVAHIAAALKTPSVVIACGSDAERWASANWRRHRIVAADVPCRPCSHAICPIGHPCAMRINTDAVWMAVDKVLTDNPSRIQPSAPAWTASAVARHARSHPSHPMH